MSLLVLLHVALRTSIIGQICWIHAVEMIGRGRAGVFQNLAPVSGAIPAVVVRNKATASHAKAYSPPRPASPMIFCIAA